MKFALIWDCSIGVSSFYTKNGMGYNFHTDKPYTFHDAVTPECYIANWNYLFMFEQGHFINLQEFVEQDLDYPELDLDLIFLSFERIALDDKTEHLYNIEKIRKKYPNAKIVGFIKEVYVQPHRFENRMKFLNNCDYVIAPGVTTMKTISHHLRIESELLKRGSHKLNYITVPFNIDWIYNKFYTNQKEASIFSYTTSPPHRRVDTFNFAQEMGRKYNLPVKHKRINDWASGEKFNYMPLKDFMSLWSPSIFHFNLDPEITQPGTQCIQVANVGSIQIGGLNESHQLLFPETATNDKKILEEKLVEYLNDDNKLFEVIKYAWDKLNEIYAPSVVKKQIMDIVNV